VLRLEGVMPSVAHRSKELAALMKSYGERTLLDEKESRAVWRSVRDVKAFASADTERPVWRISTAPSNGHKIAARITPAARIFYDWGGGLVWVAMPLANEPDARGVRAAVAEFGGHAVLIRAPVPVRAAVDVFQPQDKGVAALEKRVKESFDPRGVLNPGRMWAGV